MRCPRQPQYRNHKSSRQAVVTLDGRDIYLGVYGSDASKAAYDRHIAEWLANGRRLPAATTGNGLTVAELIVAHRRHADAHHRRADWKRTDEYAGFVYSLRPLAHLYGDTEVARFGPRSLKACREAMVRGYDHPRHGPQAPLARTVVNHHIQRVVRAFKWVASEELIPESVWRSLTTVRGLEKGRTTAKESTPVTPVAIAVVEATMEHMPSPVRGMVELMLLTGMSPGEAVGMKTGELTMSVPVWEYRPAVWKLSYRGGARRIPLGPYAQDVLRPFLRTDLAAPMFSPADAVEELHRRRHAKRVTPDSCGNGPGSNRVDNPARQPGTWYTVRSYNRAIASACRKANAPHWHANQLRHTHTTEVRRQYGIEAAQCALGHAKPDTTLIYAERNQALAVRVAAEIG